MPRPAWTTALIRLSVHTGESMRTSIISAIALLVSAWACTDAPTPSVTNPDLSVNYARVTGGACSSTTARTISSQQTDLYAKPLRDTAQARFKPVVDNCLSNPDSAKSAMLSYIQWTIDNKASILQPATGTKYGALLVHWNTVFPFVGYTGVDAPVNVPTTIFTDTGTAQLIRNPATTNDSVEIFPPNQLAALTFFHQIPGSGDTRPHLFVIYPLPTIVSRARTCSSLDLATNSLRSHMSRRNSICP
jgi:hypothetical protein